jgi:murein DD-endopeptidase MepM/ murein hydrolase activator NlpD
VELVQGERTVLLETATFTSRPAWAFWGPAQHQAELAFEVGRETVDGLTQGEATLRVSADRAPTWLRRPAPAVSEVTLPVRITPPALEVLSHQHYAVQGGAEAVVYRVGEAAVESGVLAGEAWFPGFPLPGGQEDQRFALFSVPYDLSDASGVRLTARDDVGNRAEAAFLDGFTPRPYAEGTVSLSDDFMARVVPEIVSHTADFPDQGSLLANYLWINRELRRRNRARIAELCAASRPEVLWHRPFLALPNGAVMSAFATHRTYLYDGEPVDEEFHLGYDLASVRHDDVPAANDGVVVLAEFLGIYGNVVVVDHGYGLLSLYGHLSSLSVAAGDAVQRGETLGRTGQTGLAGGDHLHFGLFLDGVAVDPVEWWDGRWIANRIAAKLGPGWDFTP